MNISYTPEQLDRLALTGYPILSLKRGDTWEAKEWGDYKAICLQMGTVPVVVLQGITPRGKRAVWEGKRNRLRKAGASEKIAQAAPSIKFGLEKSVWKLAEKFLGYINTGIMPSTRVLQELHEQCRGVYKGVAFPWAKIQSAIEIAHRAAEILP